MLSEFGVRFDDAQVRHLLNNFKTVKNNCLYFLVSLKKVVHQTSDILHQITG